MSPTTVQQVGKVEGARMQGTLTELRGLKYIDGRIVQVGKANQEKDHGRPFWLCQSQPPHAQRFQPAADR